MIYDLITIGGGSGGVAASRRAAFHGAKVAVIEGDRWGGTCVIRGCVPKKLMMYAGQIGGTLELAKAYGWHLDGARFDLAAWQRAKARETARLELVYQQMLRDAGCEAIRGRAQLEGAGLVRVGDQLLQARHILIATGARPETAPIEGLHQAMTSDELLDRSSLPRRLAVVGAGYVALEFASILAGLGSSVDVYFRSELPLRGFDLELRQRLSAELGRRGIRLHPGVLPVRLEGETGEGFVLHFQDGARASFDAVLNATGRRPNTEGLGLATVGIRTNEVGAIPVDEHSTTRVPGIHAIGDVTHRMNLTPVAIAEGRALADSLFGPVPVRFSHERVASAVFTDPQVGTVGLSEEDAAARGPVRVYVADFRPMRTAFAETAERCFMKLVVDDASDRVLGVHMLGSDAAEIVQSLSVALTAGATKADFDATVAVHPTLAEEFVLMRSPVRRTLVK